ncbi:hypothetical protein LVB87_02505 [Lysobacter sp. KIS68-7]|uniref:hypothetical protein n=1 Tax=Lysobacter sp. KIS68-7 TaxID=2904252 RepID=UPI001E586744|nr:hypothetical protein [Lysobacter sp. KIS68-7]UHQ20052.1 hypothetical protein LVB87_02505 [Lysobacter sp. KIS68-7]
MHRDDATKRNRGGRRRIDIASNQEQDMGQNQSQDQGRQDQKTAPGQQGQEVDSQPPSQQAERKADIDRDIQATGSPAPQAQGREPDEPARDDASQSDA